MTNHLKLLNNNNDNKQYVLLVEADTTTYTLIRSTFRSLANDRISLQHSGGYYTGN